MWTDRNHTPTRVKALTGILLVSLLAPFLGGCTEPWAWSLLAMAMGWLYIGLPPRHQFPTWMYLPAVATAILPLLAFLPAGWFGQSPWRNVLTHDLSITLAGTLTPQPWLTLESWLLLLLGVSWLVYVTSVLMTSDTRWNVARYYVSGVTLLAILAIASALANQPLPFWHARQHFGFFPNRNQMGDWLALAGLLVPALIYQDWGRRWFLTAWWIMAIGIIGTALVMNYSRAGVLIFFIGLTLFLIWVSVVRRWTGRLVIGLALAVSLVTLFLIFGGETLQRLQQATDPDGLDRTSYRTNMHHDALAMKEDSSWAGVGLGNFSSLFPFYREDSRSESRAIHPESDWLWLAAEAGWLTVAAVGAGLILLLGSAFPLEHGTARTLRMAAAICVLAFAGHGLLDVSAHRLGSFVPACLLVLLMLHPRLYQPATAAMRSVFRALGIVLLLFGAYGLWASLSPTLSPGYAGVIRAKNQADDALAANQLDVARATLDRALAWAPLDWELYYRRATTNLRASAEQARMDFLRARVLEPNSSLIPKQEGALWLPINPMYTMTAWNEALRRDRHNPVELFNEFVSQAATTPLVREGLKQVSFTRPDFFIVFTGQTQPEEFRQMRLQMLTRDPHLDSFNVLQKQQFFRLWADKEGVPSVVEAVQRVPAWKQLTSLYFAQHLAGKGEFQRAYVMLHAILPVPLYPQLNSMESRDTLQRRALQRPDDFATAYLLIRNNLLAEDYTEALEKARTVVTQKGCPHYFYYLQAEAAAGQGQWKEAWEALSRYQALQR